MTVLPLFSHATPGGNKGVGERDVQNDLEHV